MRQSDDESARLLLEILAEEKPPPSQVNIAALIRVGRRRARVRRLVGLGGAAVVTVGALAVVPVAVDVATRERPAPTETTTGAAAEPVPVEPTNCQPSQLPVPANTVRSQVLGGDPSGRYLVGTATDRADRTQVLRWDGGRMEVLDVPVVDPTHLAVNVHGEVAGDGYAVKKPSKRMIAWVYRDEVFTELPAGYAATLTVNGINERGDVLGLVRTLGDTLGEPAPGEGMAPPSAPTPSDPSSALDAMKRKVSLAQPMVWPASQPGGARTLDVPGNLTIVGAQALDDDGTVVGTGRPTPQSQARTSTPSPTRGLIWAPDRTVRELAAPPGQGPGTAVRSIRGDWVVGSYQSATEPAVGARWNLRTGEVRPMALKFVTAVNRAGWVAGYVLDGSGRQAPAVAFDKRTLVLPMPPKFSRNQGDSITVTISDDGRQIGSILHAGSPTAFRWTCS